MGVTGHLPRYVQTDFASVAEGAEETRKNRLFPAIKSQGVSFEREGRNKSETGY